MRLFGTPGGGLNKERSTFGFLAPFDLALGKPSLVPAPGYVMFDVQYQDVGGGVLEQSPDFPFGRLPNSVRAFPGGQEGINIRGKVGR